MPSHALIEKIYTNDPQHPFTEQELTDLEALLKSKKITYYDLFEINSNLKFNECKDNLQKQYLNLCEFYYPDDKNQDPIKLKLYQIITDAYLFMIDEEKKGKYDIDLNFPRNLAFLSLFAKRQEDPLSPRSEALYQQLEKKFTAQTQLRSEDEESRDRVMKVFIIYGDDANKTKAEISNLKTLYLNKKGIGNICSNDEIYGEKTVVFTHMSTPYHYVAENANKSYYLVVFSDGPLFIHYSTNHAFLKKLGKQQHNQLLKEHMSCNMM